VNFRAQFVAVHAGHFDVQESEIVRRLLSQSEAGIAIGGDIRLLIPIGITVGLAVFGFWWFNREAPRIAEEL
jgi:hypothetical protein